MSLIRGVYQQLSLSPFDACAAFSLSKHKPVRVCPLIVKATICFRDASKRWGLRRVGTGVRDSKSSRRQLDQTIRHVLFWFPKGLSSVTLGCHSIHHLHTHTHIRAQTHTHKELSASWYVMLDSLVYLFTSSVSKPNWLAWKCS